MEQRHQIHDPTDALAYVLGGYGRFTLVSAQTGARFTYRASQPDAIPNDSRNRPIFIGVLNGQDNEGDYRYLGCLWGTRYAHGRKSTVDRNAPSARAIEWTVRQLAAGRLPPTVEFWHEGRCGACGRALTVPESIERGLGPVCAAKAHGHANAA